MVVALVGAGISISGRAGVVYAHMPERVVLTAALWGGDPALDELMARAGKREMIAMFAFQKHQCPMAVAYRVFLRSDAGEEFEIAQIVSEESPSSLSGIGVMMNLRPGHDTQSARLLRAARTMLDQGHATLILRADPDLAIDTPGIDRVMDLDLIFEDVPVVPSQPGRFNNSGAFGDTVAARALPRELVPTDDHPQGYTP